MKFIEKWVNRFPKMLTCPLRAILIWVKTWVKSFAPESHQISPNF